MYERVRHTQTHTHTQILCIYISIFGMMWLFFFLLLSLILFTCIQQALHLIKEMDQDGDGKISEAEVLKNQETFMNSEVTDYGRQLHVLHDEL